MGDHEPDCPGTGQPLRISTVLGGLCPVCSAMTSDIFVPEEGALTPPHKRRVVTPPAHLTVTPPGNDE